MALEQVLGLTKELFPAHLSLATSIFFLTHVKRSIECEEVPPHRHMGFLRNVSIMSH